MVRSMYYREQLIIVPLHTSVCTSRKQGFRSGMASPLVPVQSRTGTHGGIGPGSWLEPG